MEELRGFLARLHDGQLTLEAFGQLAASMYVWSKHLPYPETDGNEAVRYGVSAVTIANARMNGLITQPEINSIRAALSALTPM
jgi:hypothetical protein